MMKRIRGKHIRLFLFVVMILCLTSLSAFGATIQDSGSFGSDAYWQIDSDGVLTIKPVDGKTTAYLPQVASFSANNPGASWPWHNSSYRSQIKSVRFEGNVTTQSGNTYAQIRGMFYGLTGLTSVDFTNFDSSCVAVANDMFRGCTSLESIDLTGFSSAGRIHQGMRMFSGCTNLKTVILDNTNWYRSDGNVNLGSGADNIFYNCPIETISLKNATLSVSSSNGPLTALLQNRTTLKNLDLSGVTVPSSSVSTLLSGTTNIENLNLSGTSIPGSAIANLSNLQSLDITNVSNAGDPFNLNGLPVGATVLVDGNTVLSVSSGEWTVDGVEQVDGSDIQLTDGKLADGSHTLIKTGVGAVSGTINGEVDWEIKNGVLTVKPTNGISGQLSSFSASDPLPWAEYALGVREVKIQGEVVAKSNLLNMFQNFGNLTTADVSGLNVDGCTNISGMFDGCGKLTDIQMFFSSSSSSLTINRMFQNCSSLPEIDLSGIGARISSIQSQVFGGTLSALKTLNLSNISLTSGSITLPAANVPDLETIIATNANVSFAASSNPFTVEGAWKYDDGSGTTVKKDHAEVLNGSNLPAGIYTKVADAVWGFDDIADTFYIIDNLLDGYTVSIGGRDFFNNNSPDGTYDLGEYVIKKSGSAIDVFTKVQSRSAWNNTTVTNLEGEPGYEYDMFADKPDIVITYKDAAVDVNGQRHDVVMNIDKFTFYNPSWTFSTPDPYCRYVLTVDLGQLAFRNWVYNSSYSKDGVSGNRGSGTYTNASVEIAGAEPDQTFLFYVHDLDVERRNKNGDNSDQIGVPGMEGIELGEGFDLDTLRLADNTWLRTYEADENGYSIATYASHDTDADKQALEEEYGTSDAEAKPGNYGNYIAGAHLDDESTYRTRFYVSGDATGAHFMWTSGVNCDTYFLEPAAALQVWEPLPPIYLDLEGLKTVNGLEPDSKWDQKFTAEVTLTRIETEDIHGDPLPALTTEAEFDSFLAEHPNVQLVKSATYVNQGGVFAFPRMAFDQMGTYWFNVKEQAGDDPDMEYDTREYTVKIVISGTLDDNDMIYGYRARVYSNEELVLDTYAEKELTWEKATGTVSGLTAKDFQQRAWTDGEDTYTYDPDTEQWMKNGVEPVDAPSDTAQAVFTLTYDQTTAAVNRADQGIDSSLIYNTVWQEKNDAYVYTQTANLTYGSMIAENTPSNIVRRQKWVWVDEATNRTYTYTWSNQITFEGFLKRKASESSVSIPAGLAWTDLKPVDQQTGPGDVNGDQYIYGYGAVTYAMAEALRNELGIDYDTYYYTYHMDRAYTYPKIFYEKDNMSKTWYYMYVKLNGQYFWIRTTYAPVPPSTTISETLKNGSAQAVQAPPDDVVIAQRHSFWVKTDLDGNNTLAGQWDGVTRQVAIPDAAIISSRNALYTQSYDWLLTITDSQGRTVDRRMETPKDEATAVFTDVWVRNGDSYVRTMNEVAANTFTFQYGDIRHAQSNGFTMAELQSQVWTWVDETDSQNPVTHTYTYAEGVGWVDTWTDNNGSASVLVDTPNAAATALFWPMVVTDVSLFDNWQRYDLTLAKVVSGSLGNKAQEWQFTLRLTDPQGNALNGLEIEGLTEYFREPGTYFATLRHGETLTLPKLYCGTSYRITETTREGYSVVVDVAGDTEGIVTGGAQATDTGLSDHTTVTFTNNNDTPVPTGLDLPFAPAILGLCAAFLLLTALFAGRRKRHG